MHEISFPWQSPQPIPLSRSNVCTQYTAQMYKHGNVQCVYMHASAEYEYVVYMYVLKTFHHNHATLSHTSTSTNHFIHRYAYNDMHYAWLQLRDVDETAIKCCYTHINKQTIIRIHANALVLVVYVPTCTHKDKCDVNIIYSKRTDDE